MSDLVRFKFVNREDMPEDNEVDLCPDCAVEYARLGHTLQVFGIASGRACELCGAKMKTSWQNLPLESLVEQTIDIWLGRHTYNDDLEWLENVDHMMGELSEKMGKAHKPMINDWIASDTFQN